MARKKAAALTVEAGEGAVVLEGEIVQTEAERLSALERALSEDVDVIASFEIVDADTENFAKTELDMAMSQWKELEERRTRATKPFNEGLREVNSWFKKPQALLKAIEAAWKGKLRDRALAAQAEAARLAEEAARLAQAGDASAAREALVAVAAQPTAPPVGVSIVDRWVFEVTSEAEIPREYMTPNLEAIGKVVAALKDKAKIPGVRAWNDPIVRNVIAK